MTEITKNGDDTTQIVEVARALGLPAVDCKIVEFQSQAVADHTNHCLILDGKGRPIAFAHLSSRRFPSVAKESGDAARMVSEALPKSLAQHVLTPLKIGQIEDRTYAIYQFCYQLNSGHITGKWKRYRVRTPLYDWLYDVAAQTGTKLVDTQTRDHVARLITIMSTDERSPMVIKEAARDCLTAMTKETPVFIGLSHGDLWAGNVMLSDRSILAPGDSFVVIDWRGAAMSGFPFFDFIKLSSTLRLSRKQLSWEVKRNLDLYGGSFLAADIQLLAAFGQILENLDCFPEEHFRSMTTGLWSHYMRFRH